MKARYIFPALWIVLEIVVFFFYVEPLFPVLYILSAPSVLVVLWISITLGGPRDTTYWVMVVSIVQAFLFGCVWDFVVGKIRKKLKSPELA